jgi:hypothetical protein
MTATPGLVTSVRSNALLVLTLRIKTQALSEGPSGGLLQRALKISIQLFTDRVYKKILFYIFLPQTRLHCLHAGKPYK